MANGPAPLTALAHLFFPHQCCGCDSDVVAAGDVFCFSCLATLPDTGFERLAGNPVERLFAGRLAIEAATAAYYFTEGSPLQKSLHQLKYQGRKPVGHFFGREMGRRCLAAGRFAGCEIVVPVPLHSGRQRKRGYNQAAEIARPFASALGLRCEEHNLVRHRSATSQTQKNRTDRWRQIQGSFRLRKPDAWRGRHVLLVDDVVTTGASLEAAAKVLTDQGGARVSLAVLAVSVAG